MVTFWIQHADFSTTDGRPVSVDEAIRAFSGHDWEAELAAAHKRSLSGAETCPPGIGFVPADAASDILLHICPKSWDLADVAYQYVSEPPKLLGVVRRAPVLKMASRADFAIPDVRIAIACFIRGQHADLMKLLHP